MKLPQDYSHKKAQSMLAVGILHLMFFSVVMAADEKKNARRPSSSKSESQTSRDESPSGGKQGQTDSRPSRPLTAYILREIVVTATGMEKDVFSVPYTAETLDGKVLNDQRAVRTLPEALREVPGVMVQKTGHGQGSPFIRGFTGFRTLLLIDGIRFNNAVFREGPNQYWNTVDPLTIDRLEIVKGPSSVLYGSDAIGGTVNVITRSRNPSTLKLESESFLWDRRAYYRYSSAENSNITRGELAAEWGKSTGILGGVSRKDFGDLRGGEETGKLPYTGYDELDGDLKLVERLKPGVDLILAFQRVSQENAPRTHRTRFAKSFQGTTVGTDTLLEFDQTRHLGYAQLSMKDVSDWLSKAKWTVSFQRQSETEDRLPINNRFQTQGFDDDT